MLNAECPVSQALLPCIRSRAAPVSQALLGIQGQGEYDMRIEL